MRDKLIKILNKIYKGRGEYSEFHFMDIDENLRDRFFNSILFAFIIMAVSIIISIPLFNPYFALFGLLFAALSIINTSIKIDNFLNGKITKIVGTYYDSNLPTAKRKITQKLEKEKDFFTDKAFYVQVVTANDIYVKIPVPRNFPARKGSEITAFVNEAKGYYDDNDVFIAQDCYYAYISKSKEMKDSEITKRRKTSP